MLADRLDENLLETALSHDERRLHDEVARFHASLATHPLLGASHQASLRRLLRAMLNVSGKRVRPLLPYWLERAHGGHGDPAATDRVALVTLLLHSAAIVIDDIEDESVERQCQPSLHIREGRARTLNAASLLVFEALEALKSPWLAMMASTAVLNCHVGQAMDLDNADPRVAGEVFANSHAERVARYRQTAELKTSQLMELSVRAGGRAIGVSADEIEPIALAVRRYGFAYQVLDDVKNFRPDLVGQKAYEDLDAGLRSFVFLQLLDKMTTAELVRARWTYGTPDFKDVVLSHPRLDEAMRESVELAVAVVKDATDALERSVRHDGARGYVTALLGRPIDDLAVRLGGVA